MNVVITGASYGLGRALAIDCSRQGATVAFFARNLTKLQETHDQLKNPEKHLFLALDLRDKSAILEASTTLNSFFSHVDVLINNAAGWYCGSIMDMNDEDIESQISSTITGNILFTKHLIPLLEKSIKPQIINISSVAALPNPNIDPSSASVAYYASKWGFTGFSESLRSELAEKRVRVTTIYPGKIETDSSLDDSPNLISDKFGKKVMGVKDIVDSINFCLSMSPNAYVHSLTIREF